MIIICSGIITRLPKLYFNEIPTIFLIFHRNHDPKFFVAATMAL